MDSGAQNLYLLLGTLTVLHHDGEEAHNNLGAGPDEDLAFPTLLSVVDAFQGICQNVHAHHDACGREEARVKRAAASLDPLDPPDPCTCSIPH